MNDKITMDPVGLIFVGNSLGLSQYVTRNDKGKAITSFVWSGPNEGNFAIVQLSIVSFATANEKAAG